MSERFNRSIEENRLLLPLIVILVVAAFAGLYFWSRLKPSEPPPQQDVQKEMAQTVEQILDDRVEMLLYFPAAGLLLPQPVDVERQPDTQLQAKAALAALFANKRAGLTPVLKDIRLRAFYLDASGIAYIDVLPSGSKKSVRGSAWDELLAIHAIVNTLAGNFDEIKKVYFLIDGKREQTLAGHIDLSSFFRQRKDLVQR